MKIAIMQPYFFPYLGYFKLFEKVDLFMIYDCVQFPRRGWVHRNRIQLNSSSKLEWVTLPIQKSPQSTKIEELKFQKTSDIWFKELNNKLKKVSRLNNLELQYNDILVNGSSGVVGYLETSMRQVCDALGLSAKIVRSSSFDVEPNLKAQDRILELCRRVGASHYVNLPGGKELYDKDSFKSSGIRLEFLSEFQGSYESVLGRWIKESLNDIKAEFYK